MSAYLPVRRKPRAGAVAIGGPMISEAALFSTAVLFASLGREITMSSIELFERWFGRSIEKLAELPNGDGAFAALMISLPLYDRFIHAKLKLEGRPATDAFVQGEIEADLGLTDHQRRVFWAMFRNGFMHQGMAKDGKTKWVISHVYGALPVFRTIAGQEVICLDPWKFTDRVLAKFRADHRLITASESFPWPGIFILPSEFTFDNDNENDLA